MSQFPWKPNLYNSNPLGDDSCVIGDRVVRPNCSLHTVLWFIYSFYLFLFSTAHSQFPSEFQIDYYLLTCWGVCRGMISRSVSGTQNVRLPEEWLTIFELDNIQRYSRVSQSQLCATSQRPVPVTTAPDKREAPYYSAFRQYISPVCLWVPFQKPELSLDWRDGCSWQTISTKTQETFSGRWGKWVISGTSGVPRNNSAIHCKAGSQKSLNNALENVSYENCIYLRLYTDGYVTTFKVHNVILSSVYFLGLPKQHLHYLVL